MSKVSTVVLSENYSTLEVIRLFVDSIENLEFVNTGLNGQEILETISSFDKTSLFIVDLTENKNDKLDLILRISKSCKKCKILALSDNPSVNLIIEIMRAGAKEFLPIPVIKNEFIDVVEKITKESNEYPKKNSCKIISVFSNKGGLGKTSLASNLALELAKITKENIALIDLNFQMGDITTFLDLRPSFNISYMLENLEKINETFLLSTLEKYKDTSLYILADPPYFKQADNIKPAQIKKLFEILKDTFSYIVVDAESSFDGKNIAALDDSDMILLVTVANLPALRNTQRCLELFYRLGYDREKIKIVVNRYMENDEIKETDVEKVLSKPIFWKIPNNYFTIMTSINKGIPVSDVNETTNLAQSYKNLAKNIADNSYKINLAEKFENILNNK